MKGSKCRCKYATVSQRRVCPRCGRTMRSTEWPDEGKVLSFARLHVVPEGLKEPYNLVLVGIDKGPKLICWTAGILKDDDLVTIVESDGNMFCGPKAGQTSRSVSPVKA